MFAAVKKPYFPARVDNFFCFSSCSRRYILCSDLQLTSGNRPVQQSPKINEEVWTVLCSTVQNSILNHNIRHFNLSYCSLSWYVGRISVTSGCRTDVTFFLLFRTPGDKGLSTRLPGCVKYTRIEKHPSLGSPVTTLQYITMKHSETVSNTGYNCHIHENTGENYCS